MQEERPHHSCIHFGFVGATQYVVEIGMMWFDNTHQHHSSNNDGQQMTNVHSIIIIYIIHLSSIILIAIIMMHPSTVTTHRDQKNRLRPSADARAAAAVGMDPRMRFNNSGTEVHASGVTMDTASAKSLWNWRFIV